MSSAAQGASPAKRDDDDRNAFEKFIRSRMHPEFLVAGPDLYRRAKTAVMFAMIGMAFAIFFTSLNIQFHITFPQGIPYE